MLNEKIIAEIDNVFLNYKPSYIIKKEFDITNESGLPIEIVVGQKTPFEVKYLDDNLFSDSADHSTNNVRLKDNEGYLPTKSDIDSLLLELRGNIENVGLNMILRKFE